MPSDRWFRFVPHHLAPDYLLTGWYDPNVDLAHHGEYSVLLEWLCDCPLPAIRRVNPEEPPYERHRAVLPFLPRPAPEADV